MSESGREEYEDTETCTRVSDLKVRGSGERRRVEGKRISDRFVGKTFREELVEGGATRRR